MTRILHRQTRIPLPVAVAGEGPYVIDSVGRRYLDASGGAAVSCLGHSHRSVIEAIKAQLDALPYAHTSFFTNEPAEALAEHLTQRAPAGISHVYFVSGGSEANETAFKLARQYFWNRGERERSRIIARQQSYHGNTLGALAVGGNAGRRAVYEPLLIEVSHIEPCYAYRHRRDDESEGAYGERAAAALEAEVLRLGPGTVMAFVAETVVGATLGAVPAAPGYFRRIREICDRYGILLILDEVMSGMGRTGTLFACEQDGVTPDIVTCAKGLGAGYQPIGACLMSSTIYDTIALSPEGFQHGFTYIGHASACAGALAVQRAIEAEGLLDNCRKQGIRLAEALGQRFAQHAHVGDIRGRGLFIGVELVADRETKQPFAAQDRLNTRVKAKAMEAGLMCYPAGGTADGVSGDHILLAPPFIIAASHVEEIVDKLAAAIDGAIAEVRA
ncbi:aspartate aminotransferase family protein [Chelatococcus sp. XZ-Ab1]|uniref:aspartate aminotransferase family protein n=1 Tax=Chelatococcus sp. XZ-Ab1 TaxID=3034027 RepID=UPI0023E3E1C7|nr:aspartate aminotransferase family protein [Chelatococcus sp. XZ-Ab1]